MAHSQLGASPVCENQNSRLGWAETAGKPSPLPARSSQQTNTSANRDECRAARRAAPGQPAASRQPRLCARGACRGRRPAPAGCSASASVGQPDLGAQNLLDLWQGQVHWAIGEGGRRGSGAASSGRQGHGGSLISHTRPPEPAGTQPTGTKNSRAGQRQQKNKP